MKPENTETRQHIARRLVNDGAVAVIRMRDTDRLIRVIESLHEGGISAIEVTMTVPDALEAIRTLARQMSDDVLLGVGSVLEARTVSEAVAAGARFVVSPVFKRELIDVAHQHGVPAIPGTTTPTEMQHAHEAGADLIKMFPARLLGQDYLKSVLAPLPHLKIMPTGGVTPENAGDWLRAGAAAVGLGSALLDRDAVAEGRYDQLTENARRLRRSVDQERAPA